MEPLRPQPPATPAGLGKVGWGSRQLGLHQTGRATLRLPMKVTPHWPTEPSWDPWGQSPKSWPIQAGGFSPMARGSKNLGCLGSA